MCVNKIVIEFLNLHFQWVVIFQTDFYWLFTEWCGKLNPDSGTFITVP